jgi:hypothetical protein
MQRSELREAHSVATDNRVCVAGELLFALEGGLPGARGKLGGPGVGPAVGDLVDDIDEVVVRVDARELVEARDDRQLARLHRRYQRVPLLILDELNFVPLDKVEAELLFNLLADRYERCSTIVTQGKSFRSRKGRTND